MPPRTLSHEETAKLLIYSGASLPVVEKELVKLGTDEKTAKHIGRKIYRRYRIKKVAPYFVAIGVVMILTFILAGWQWATALGLFSLLGVRSLFLADKRPKAGSYLTKNSPRN
jgi:hypothetical protein